VTEPYVRQLPEAPDLPHRLGRAGVNHDPRSRQFAFTAPEPRPVVDVAWKRRVGVYDQGNLGSCTAHALCGALSTLPHKHRFRSERNIVKVYSSATAVDPWPGGEYEVYGLDAVEHRAWCWNSWGPGWGAGGRFWLSWDSLRELLASDGDATVLVP
jgi:hypothetical protein